MVESDSVIVDCVTMLAEAFGRTVTAATFTAYEMGLEGMAQTDVMRATKEALRSCRFMPTPGELRELAGAQLRPEDRAAKVWLVFNEACQPPLWLWCNVSFDDPVLNATVRALGGWPEVSRLKNGHRGSGEYIQFFKPQFEKTYAALVRSGVTAEQAAPLAGHLANGQPVHHVVTGLPGLPGPRPLPAIAIERPADIPRLELKRA